jgi:hypothetical protein
MKLKSFSAWRQHTKRFSSLTLIFDSRNGNTHCLDELCIAALKIAGNPVEQQELQRQLSIHANQNNSLVDEATLDTKKVIDSLLQIQLLEKCL